MTTTKFNSTQIPEVGATKSIFVAGENITAGNALFISGNDGKVYKTDPTAPIINVLPEVSITSEFDNVFAFGTTFANEFYGNKVSQTFSMTYNSTISTCKIWLKNRGTPTDSVNIRIETTSGGLPTGTLVNANAIVNKTAASLTSDFVEYTITFPGTFTLTGGVLYSLVLERTGTLNDGNSFETKRSSGNQYLGGTMYRQQSGTWFSTSADLAMFIKSTTSYIQEGKINFIGFATNTVLANANVIVDTSGVSATQTGLTVGSDYYLSNTAGLISITPGTNVRRVGVATSTTSIQLETDKNDSLDGVTSTTATTGSVTLGNAVGYITVKINGVNRKIPYYS